MPTTALSLPIDVPWKRLAFSDDMYLRQIDWNLPLWRSSVAVFYYEPEPDPNDNTGEVTTFLKVIATVTGFTHWQVFHWEGGIIDPLNVYYPAMCALLEVAVLPSPPPQNGGFANLADYPYIADFEPKTREIIETSTQTGETVSHTSEKLSVTKSTTSTGTTSEINRLSWSGAGTSSGSQEGIRTITPNSTVSENIVTDPSRERRETSSYTSEITQLYHLLESYHSGTNRALFLMTARPFLVDSGYTFVNGPRRLEGIQEFFVIVRRPKSLRGICVKATLETAHLDPGDTNPLLTLFTTARAVSGCTIGGQIHMLPSGSWVTSEKTLPNKFLDVLEASGQSGQEAVFAANALTRLVRDEHINSFGSQLRYPIGSLDFEKTNFMMRKITSKIGFGAVERHPNLLASLATIQNSLARQQTLLSKDDIASRQHLLDLLNVSNPAKAPAAIGHRS